AADLPGIETVVVKEALGRQAARSLHPLEACRRIEEGAYRAYAERSIRPLYQPRGPFTLEIDWMNASMADSCAQIPDVERTGGRSRGRPEVSTPAAREAIGRAPSTSRQRPRWWRQGREFLWPSTATGRPPAAAEAPTCSRRSGWISLWTLTVCDGASTSPEWASVLHRPS